MRALIGMEYSSAQFFHTSHFSSSLILPYNLLLSSSDTSLWYNNVNSTRSIYSYTTLPFFGRFSSILRPLRQKKSYNRQATFDVSFIHSPFIVMIPVYRPSITSSRRLTVLVIGSSGCGKTSALQRSAREQNKDERRVGLELFATPDLLSCPPHHPSMSMSCVSHSPLSLSISLSLSLSLSLFCPLSLPYVMLESFRIIILMLRQWSRPLGRSYMSKKRHGKSQINQITRQMDMIRRSK